MKISVVLDGEKLFSLVANNWLLLQPTPDELQLAVNQANPLVSPVTNNSKEDAFYKKVEAGLL